jgi:hypothetical protein
MRTAQTFDVYIAPAQSSQPPAELSENVALHHTWWYPKSDLLKATAPARGRESLTLRLDACNRLLINSQDQKFHPDWVTTSTAPAWLVEKPLRNVRLKKSR